MINDNVYSIHRNAYTFTSILHVELVEETERALKFVLLDNKKLTMWLPKKAVKLDKENQFFNLARWFSFNEYQSDIWSRYANCYKK